MRSGTLTVGWIWMACILAAGGWLGCDSPSPTEPRTPASASGLSVVLRDDGGPLVARFDVIRRHLEAVHQSASRQLPIGGITAVVESEPDPLFTGWGVAGGFQGVGSTEVEIKIRPQLPDELLAEQLSYVAAHEFHHVARSRGPGYGFGTLLEALVSEGLADHFAEEHLGQSTPHWLLAFSPEELERWLERARPLFDTRNYGHFDWFFGANPEIPRGIGYALGYELVSRYQARYGGASAASLWDTPAEAFRPD